MKIIATVILLLAGHLSFAYGDEQINWPAINGLSVNNACATDETFKSLRPVRVCTESKTVRYAVSNQGELGLVRRLLGHRESPRYGEWLEQSSKCVAYGKQDMEVSRYYTYGECAYNPHYGEVYEPCNRYTTKRVKAGLTYSVEKIVHYGEADQQTFFKFRVPLCK